MRSHRFTLVLAGVRDIEPNVADALCEATGGDIEFNVCNGVAVLEFDRKAPTLQHAIVTAVEQVESAKAGVRVIRVESEEPQVSDEELERRATEARTNPDSCFTTEQVRSQLKDFD